MRRYGALEKAKARCKVIVGKATGHERLEAEGRTDEVKARIREKATSIRRRAEGVKDSLRRHRS
ncbi:CsbD family protein [Streptomyces sp. YS415]|uniref:CsbD family protein n=1 Tax=Streptomyces sp. YS415 TaxID=2944806 RepID=UPI00201FE48B|nr:CsbD family protein [Streptomyces sp. YS415]MCL7425497.1 CsbD family protein [Streptomyces sp. YS415]